MSSRKVVVSNKSALRAKYKNSGWKKIEAALGALVEADAARGVATEIVFLDMKRAMKALDAPAVSDAGEPEQNKRAIDAVVAARAPAYLMILGAPDVVAHQSLRNPTGDEDVDVPSDLPYACEAPYSRRIEDFLAPTRVVGRLPGIPGGHDASYLVALLERAAGWSGHSPKRYEKPFGVSAQAWQGSTRMSLRKIFGRGSDMELSPEAGPRWKKGLLGRMAHFINLHGAASSPAFYGDPGYPEAHRADVLAGCIREGTVVAAECCYGAELYPPSEYIPAGICSAYLGEGAYAFVGSTNIAYGPVDENGAADLICQHFFRHLLGGASTGRAMLQARQDYVKSNAPIDPIDLKTVAQFSLLGDPSIHPVKLPARATAARRKQVEPDPAARAKRRQSLQRKGRDIASTCAAVRSRADQKPSADMARTLAALCIERGIDQDGKVSSFSVKAAARAAPARGVVAKSRAPGDVVYHLIPGHKKCAAAQADTAPGTVPASRAPRKRRRKASAGPEPVRIQDRVLLLVKASQGKILDVREYVPRSTVRPAPGRVDP